MIELALCLFDLGGNLPVLRMLGDGDIGITVEPGELDLCLLTKRFELALVGLESGLRLIINRLRDGVAVQQHHIAVVVGLIQPDLRLFGGDIAEHAFVVLLHRVDDQPSLRQVGLGVVERNLKLPGIEPVQHLPGPDALVIRDFHALDDAGNIGRDWDFFGIDIGVIRRHDLAARDVPITADQERQRQERKKTPAHPAAAIRPGRPFLFRSGPHAGRARHRRGQRCLAHFRRLVVLGRDGFQRALSHSAAPRSRPRQSCFGWRDAGFL